MSSSSAVNTTVPAYPSSTQPVVEKKLSVVFQNFRFPNYLVPSFDFRRWRRVSTSITGTGVINRGDWSIATNNNVNNDNQTGPIEGDKEYIAEGRSNSTDSDTSSISSYNTTITSPKSLPAIEEEEVVQLHGNVESQSRGREGKAAQQSLPKQKRKERQPVIGSTTYMKCRKCQSDICFSSDVISKGFMGRHGRAYLIKSLPPHTHTLSKPISRQLVTGTHIVSDICCSVCQTNLGWKYINAEEEAQRYKIGKYILETKKMIKINRWEQTCTSDDDYDGDTDVVNKEDEIPQFQLKSRKQKSFSLSSPSPSSFPSYSPRFPLKEQDMWDLELEMAEHFGDVNSEDDDELEDMFLGRWTPKLAAKRRKSWEKQQLAKSAAAANSSIVNKANSGVTGQIARRATAHF